MEPSIAVEVSEVSRGARARHWFKWCKSHWSRFVQEAGQTNATTTGEWEEPYISVEWTVDATPSSKEEKNDSPPSARLNLKKVPHSILMLAKIKMIPSWFIFVFFRLRRIPYSSASNVPPTASEADAKS